MPGDLHILVAEPDAGTRLDAYLRAQDSCPSRSACARLVEAGAVAVNGEVCLSKKYAVAVGDRISVELPEEEALSGAVIHSPFRSIFASKTSTSSSYLSSAVLCAIRRTAMRMAHSRTRSCTIAVSSIWGHCKGRTARHRASP